MVEQVSQTTAQAGNTLTYSIVITVTGNNAANLVVTDQLPPNVTFTQFLSSPAGTSSSAPSSNQLSWTLSSTLAPGTYQITYQVTVNSFVQSGVVLTNTAQVTYTGLNMPLTSSVNVMVSGGSYTVKVNVYNSSGEVVKQILTASFSQPVDNINLPSGNTITTLQGPGSSIQIDYDDVLIGTWDGSNNSSSPAANGVYILKIDSIGSVGLDTSVSQQITVNRQLSNVTVNIFNSSGEVVKHIYSMVSDSNSVEMTDVNLSTSILKPGVMTASSSLSKVQIFVMTSGSPVTLSWNAVDDAGNIVTPGHYEIEVFWDNGQGTVMNITRGILVVVENNITGTVVAKPNVLMPSQGTMTVIFDGTDVQGGAGIRVSIYTVTGELVKNLSDTGGTAQASWTASGVASGLYVCSVRVLDSNGDNILAQTLKVLVLH
jgi:fimbrial isopeptide formation D2 family protein